jgi:ABC-2 type transport system permease protein
MAVKAGSQPLRRLPAISIASRLYGFGSIYGKTIRDSRLTFIIITGVLAGMMLVAAESVKSVFPDAASRKEVGALISSIPSSLTGLFGHPIRVNTLGGMANWKFAPWFALGAGLWSLLALSGTLAGEAARGSLDIVASSPLGKRRVALEKLGAHVTLMALSMVILAFMTWLGATVFGEASLGDAIPPLNATGFALWVGFIGLACGGLAFALAPLLGRAGSAGVAAAVMVGGFVANGYAASVPGLGVIADFSWFHWTANHAPLVGQFDWPALALVGLVAGILMVIGVELFARRDVGVTAGISLPGLPKAILGVHGPIDRAFGELLPRALAWGIGLGLFGLVMASLTGQFAEQIGKEPRYLDFFRKVFPDVADVASAGGLMQVYAEILFIVAGFAGATLVSKWASDEIDGRLETLLATPLARARWAISGGLSAFAAIVVMILLMAAGIGIGAVSAGTEPGNAMLGSASLGLYAAAIVGIGVAIGGLWRNTLSAELASVFVVATFLIDLLAPPLNLPTWFHNLALTAHMGQPMVGQWNMVGIAGCLAVAFGGVLIGAWGMRRRDVNPG